MDLPWKSLPDWPDIDLPNLPDLSGLSNIDLPDIDLPNIDLPERLPDLSAIGTLAVQFQAVISSAIAHPIWAIVVVLLSITFIQIIADLIKRSLKALLTLLLKFPLLISQWIWKRTVSPKALSKTQRQATVDQLIAKLEALRQEQDQVLSELKSLLHQPAISKPAPPSEDSKSLSPQKLEPPPAGQIPSP